MTAAARSVLTAATLALLPRGLLSANPRLARPFNAAFGYRFANLGDQTQQDRDDETFIALTFSGGGTRAAAFAYGAMEALRATKLADGRSLLDEVDVISSVSGGSFAAAYYGLFGRSSFSAASAMTCCIVRSSATSSCASWPLELAAPALTVLRLAPISQPPTTTAPSSRAAGSTHAAPAPLYHPERHRHRRRRAVLIHAGLLRSDLLRPRRRAGRARRHRVVGVSRRLHSADGQQLRGWGVRLRSAAMGRAAEHGDFDANPPRFDLARTWRSYEDATRRPYIHLSDGGLSDNIGLRAIENGIWSTGSLPVDAQVNNRKIKRLVIIVVDAKPRTEASADQFARDRLASSRSSRPRRRIRWRTTRRIRSSSRVSTSRLGEGGEELRGTPTGVPRSRAASCPHGTATAGRAPGAL